MAVSKIAEFKDGCHHQFEWEWTSEVFFVQMAESMMAEYKMAAIIKFSKNESDWIRLSQSFVQNGWIQDGCHLLFSQIELVWVRVRLEGECFWVNLREDNKVSQSKMAVFKSKMAEFKMAAIIKLSQNEWVNFFLCK